MLCTLPDSLFFPLPLPAVLAYFLSGSLGLGAPRSGSSASQLSLPPGSSPGCQLLPLRLAPPVVPTHAPAFDPPFASTFGSCFSTPFLLPHSSCQAPWLSTFRVRRTFFQLWILRLINLLLDSPVWRAISPVMRRRSIPLRSPLSARWVFLRKGIRRWSISSSCQLPLCVCGSSSRHVRPARAH